MKECKMIDVNGKQQFLSISANEPDLPLLLYLHGGPGDAALPLVNKYNAPLQSEYTVVVWEQRGCGKSYYPFTPEENLTIQTFVDDIYCIVKYLLTRFHQQKVYLLGHSWGSVLGMKFIFQYPHLVHTYIGCGQVINMQSTAKHQYDYVLAKCKEHKKADIQERLEKIDLSFQQENWMEDLLYVTRLVVKFEGSLYGQTSYNKFVKDFILTKDYTLKDKLNREKGSMQSIQRLWPELMKVNFSGCTEFRVPVILIEGRHDHHVDAQLAKQFYDEITTKKTWHWVEKACHFPQWSEPEIFNQILLSLV